MDEELLELQRQFEFAQQVKSSVRLSDRNVVELVQKLQELRVIDFDLLHTVTGKEYITQEQLKNEIATEISKLGRVSVIDLADTIGVDLYHVEKQAQDVVLSDPGLMLVQGEIISQTYWDSIAEEINERLQECSQISVAELAGQLQVGSELVQSVLEPRLGTLVKARLEGGQLYTPAYVARVTAMVRGASRGIFVPSNLSALWAPLQQLVQQMNGSSGVAVENAFFQSIFNRLLKEEEMLGSLRAGTHWTPSVFAVAQKECVDSFFSQNSYIPYETMQKLGISQAVQFLQSRYPDGKPLSAVFIHSSMIEMLDSTTEDAIEQNSWIDSLSVLPASFTSQDANKILLLCPSVQSALKAEKALILAESYVISSGFIKGIYDQIEKDAEAFSIQASTASLIDHPSKSSESQESIPANTDKGSKKKRGKSASMKTATVETVPDDEEEARPKSKRNQKKGRDSSSSQKLDAKAGGKKESVKAQEGNNFIPPDGWVMKKIVDSVPEFEDEGMENPDSILKHLADLMRPMLINSLKERRKKIFTENADRMKRLKDDLQKKLDESFLNMQLYEKALELFEDDQSTSAVLHRHLLRTTAATIADTLLHDLDILNNLKNGIEVGDSKAQDSVLLESSERMALAKNLNGSLSRKALALVEALEGKRVDAFMTTFRDLAEESGLALKKLDKKLERTLLHAYRKDLISQVSTESDPVALLAKVVSLLYIKAHNKALQAPGRAIAAAISHLKDKLDESAYKTLTDYQKATVTLLALMSASTGEEHDCSADRILSKRELLESQMPVLRSLVLGDSQPQQS
ncbi:E3 UFM1-protein ligase 1 homolog [Brassica rapa]|uniref:E3 UFM1-protein ligase 1 homolog n=1 Tax=Brassica campestris TaxID=3711 RepID=M4DNX9_BRACM|nr:E3 UFM1-protein ligase 1 homolog [Brassica rapa]XP_022543175.2 E3 UFM1-protein ligase 1 homolog [Brassica napus]